MKATAAARYRFWDVHCANHVFWLRALLIAIPIANGAAQFIGGGMAQYLNVKPRHSRLAGTGSASHCRGGCAIDPSIFPIITACATVTVREAFSDTESADAKPKWIGQQKHSSCLAPIRISLRNAMRRKTRLILTCSRWSWAARYLSRI